MTPPPAHDAATLLTASRDNLVAFCATLAPEDWRRKRDSEWSPAEVLEHLAILEGLVSARLAKMLSDPAEPDWREHTADKDGTLHRAASRENKLKSPPAVHPKGQSEPAQLLREFGAAREVMVGLAKNSVRELEQRTREHPVFGVCNGRQWLELCAHHTERHLKQMKEAASQA